MKAIDRLAAIGERWRRRQEGQPDASVSAPGPTAIGAGPAPEGSGSQGSGSQGLGPEGSGPAGSSRPDDTDRPTFGPFDVLSVEHRPDSASGFGPDVAVDPAEEAQLWRRLREDPNDVEAFPRLADIVRRRAAEGHEGGHRQRAADDAVWALAEELAHNGRAWYPLVELARLSVHDDRDAALRRLHTAAERDPSGHALAWGLSVLRDAGMPNDALGLGMAHWRPREHDLEAGRHLVLAAVEARRVGDARRHLDALSAHPDAGRVAGLRAELESLILQLEAERAAGGPMTDPAGISVTGPLTGPLPTIDLRDKP